MAFSFRRDSDTRPSQKSSQTAPCFFRSMRTPTLRPFSSVTNWIPLMISFSFKSRHRRIVHLYPSHDTADLREARGKAGETQVSEVASMAHVRNTPSPVDGAQLERRIAHDYFVRFHMTVILAAVISSGVLASKCLMELGVSLRFRYPIAVLASYLVFLLLIRVWIWYVTVRSLAAFQLGNLNFGGGGGGGSFGFGGQGGSGSGGGFSGFGGGSSGGGGASSSWEAEDGAALASQPSSRSEERRVGKECRSRWSPYH